MAPDFTVQMSISKELWEDFELCSNKKNMDLNKQDMFEKANLEAYKLFKE